MPSTAPRRITAALTAAFVACALIVLGGASSSAAPTQRLAIGHSHAGLTGPTAHVGSTSGKHHVAPRLDLASTAPSVDPVTPTGSPDVTPSAYTSRVERDLAVPTGRGPPAL